jgi:uncharacterized alpha-E superfamily protein
MYKCLLQTEVCLHTITGNENHPATQQISMLRNRLEQANVKAIFQAGLHEFIDQFQQDLNVASNHIFDSFAAVDSLVSAQQTQQ